MFTNLNSSNDNQKSNPAPQTSSSFMNQKRYQFLGEVKKSKRYQIYIVSESREEILRKRRNMMYKEFTESDKPNTINIDASTDQILEKLYDDLFSSDPQAIFTSLLTFRQISDTGNKDDIYYFEDIQVILNFNKHIDLILNVFSKIVDDLQEEVQVFLYFGLN